MTTVNMKDYVNGNVNENKAVQEVIGKISKAETKVVKCYKYSCSDSWKQRKNIRTKS